MSRPSQRFSPSKWSQYLVPLVLGILLLGLVGTIIVIVLSVIGLMPGT
jgi:preprotein translocase subunit Sss1